jgi:hypothetical protein
MLQFKLTNQSGTAGAPRYAVDVNGDNKTWDITVSDVAPTGAHVLSLSGA